MTALIEWVSGNAVLVGTGAFMSGVALFYLVMTRMLKHRKHPAFLDRLE